MLSQDLFECVAVKIAFPEDDDAPAVAHVGVEPVVIAPVVEKAATPAPAPKVVALATIAADNKQPFSGVWQLTALYEPKNTLVEHNPNTLWIQAKSGVYVDLRVPSVEVVENDSLSSASGDEQGKETSAPATTQVAPHDKRQIKSFAGRSVYTRDNAHLAWTRSVDFRGIPTQDVGAMQLLVGEQTVIEESVLPGDDFREVWTKVAAPVAVVEAPVVAPVVPVVPAKSWSKIVAPVVAEVEKKAPVKAAAPKEVEEPYDERAEVSAVLTRAVKQAVVPVPKPVVKVTAGSKKDIKVAVPAPVMATAPVFEEVGFFVSMDGFFALTLNLRGKSRAAVPSVEELRNYFNPPVTAPVEVNPEAAPAPVEKEKEEKVKTVFSYANIAKKVVDAPVAQSNASKTSKIAASTPKLTTAEIETYLAQYVTVFGTSHNFKVLHATDATFVGKALFDLRVPVSHGENKVSAVKITDLLVECVWKVESGRLHKDVLKAIKKPVTPVQKQGHHGQQKQQHASGDFKTRGERGHNDNRNLHNSGGNGNGDNRPRSENAAGQHTSV
eukprot:scaffold403_cov183-Ochromonas_danica.AAC.3